MQKKIHLVLGSGGARGIAHIGVIEMLEEAGFEIISVTGCSMGAVVGGMYCAGSLTEYKKWLLTLTKTNVLRLFDFTLSRQGFVKGEKVLNQLKVLAGEQLIENFKIPFIAVATDLLHKKEIHFSEGNLYKALRASMGIPGVFTPVVESNCFLVDGSVLNPLPLNLVNKQPGEIIVAVNLNGHTPSVKIKPTVANETVNTAETWTWLKKFMPFTNNKQQAGTLPSFSMFDLVNTSYDFTLDRLTELVIQLFPPDILIEIPRKACSVFEFYKAAELIEIGRNCCNKARLQYMNEQGQLQ
ncbi:MAG: patatin-like phospholipase family protein [Chitinophagaceae bacterium]|nr:patatin-like phospholipase family protein [Chitinophagaceae bacterium]